jgi:DNA polymerase III alpha subunit (gram-positive type)
LNLSSTEFSFVYEYFYKGENDFSTFKQVDINDGYKVTLSIMEGGFSKFLKAYSQKANEIPCNKTEPTAIKVRMDGVPFDNTMNFVIPEF